MQHVSDYIIEHHGGNKSEFARIQGVHRTHVHYWCRGEYYMHNHKMYHFTRDMK
jgi:hypothetical protein